MTYPLNPFAHIPKYRDDMASADAADARRRQEDWKQYDVARGSRDMIRPSVTVAGTKYNIIKQANPDTVYATTDPSGALVSTSTAEEQYWVHFATESTLGAMEGVLAKIENFGLTNTSGGDALLAGFLLCAMVDTDWDPGALTWNTKPADFATGNGNIVSASAGTVTTGGTVARTTTVPGTSDQKDMGRLDINEVGSTVIYGIRFRLNAANANTRINIDNISGVRVFV